MSEQKPREFWIDDHVLLVDAEDYPLISRMNWHIKKDKNTFYAFTNVKIGGKQTSVSMHRIVCGLPSSQIDHINRNGLDNRKANLRFATPAQNSCNRVRYNKLGYRGVFKEKRSSRFSVQIQFNGKKYHERGFATPEDAAKRYDELSREFHGEFGIRNFKD